MKDAFAIIYADQGDARLRELIEVRSVSALPVGGRYRAIDFVLSNVARSGIRSVGIIAQRNYKSLMDHLGSGKDWNLSRKQGGLDRPAPLRPGQRERPLPWLRRRPLCQTRLHRPPEAAARPAARLGPHLPPGLRCPGRPPPRERGRHHAALLARPQAGGRRAALLWPGHRQRGARAGRRGRQRLRVPLDGRLPHKQEPAGAPR